jgi:hypothetical protein
MVSDEVLMIIQLAEISINEILAGEAIGNTSLCSYFILARNLV